MFVPPCPTCPIGAGRDKNGEVRHYFALSALECMSSISNKIGAKEGEGIEVAATDSKWQASISKTRMSRKRDRALRKLEVAILPT